MARNQPRSIRGSPTLQISQSMTAVTVAPDRQQVAEPEVAVHDRRGHRRRFALAEARRPRRPSPGASARVDRLEQPAPAVHLRRRGPTTGSAARPRDSRVERVQRRRACGAASRMRSATTASGSSPCRSNSGSSESPSTNDMTNSGGIVGRIAGVLPQHLGHRHRGAVQRPDQPRLAQHVAIEHRRQPRRRDLDHDAPARRRVPEYVRLDAPPASGATSSAPSGREPMRAGRRGRAAVRACA